MPSMLAAPLTECARFATSCDASGTPSSAAPDPTPFFM
eukprot:CAMPEP_0181237498 /NCGR_PEP_ID=MMETSP1096-20121128/38796_1 /TAXON_ID=156174 ORGANISM="Chrysochromulina ericina, Strain CCMP281" /NCGR_SAMPLE_ID=MMETSP1096 /ASSEMBLY_ACC=CAM_ASM_000453 /LENGTH=37 /DNA_ID= /DNA_START= /DNA_END= /DNA_ORIENTATION=